MNRKAQYAFLALTLTLLAACSQLGIPKAETFNQRLAAGYTTVTSVRNSARILLNASAISATDAQNVQDQADQARAGLDLARSMHTALPDAGEDKLLSAQKILAGLTEYLAQRQRELQK